MSVNLSNNVVSNSGNLDQNNSLIQKNELINPDNDKFHKLFKDKVDDFTNIYNLAPGTLSKLNSREFSAVVKLAEDQLIAAEKMYNMNPTKDMLEKITTMKKQFDELVKLIPLGPSILLKRDVDIVKKITSIPSDEKFSSKWGDYYSRKTTALDISGYLQNFCEQYGYSGTSISIETDKHYRDCKNRMMTTIGFRKKKIQYPQLQWISSIVFSKENPELQIEELKNLISRKLEEWNYESFEVNHTSNTKDQFPYIESKEQETWGCYVFLYYKKIENSPSKPLIEEIKQEQITELEKPKELPNKSPEIQEFITENLTTAASSENLHSEIQKQDLNKSEEQKESTIVLVSSTQPNIISNPETQIEITSKSGIENEISNKMQRPVIEQSLEKNTSNIKMQSNVEILNEKGEKKNPDSKLEKKTERVPNKKRIRIFLNSIKFYLSKFLNWIIRKN